MNTRTYIPRRRQSAFTLTEILIALALVAVLLIGITRIFEITSKTIGTGQALSKAVRTQKAIQQTISADIVGVLPTSANIRPYSGMMPVNDAKDPDAGMPFLAICNYRVPAYVNQSAMSGDSIAPTDAVTNFIARSAAIRGTDLDKNGIESTTSIAAAGGETVPLFSYGDRNFRCDTIGFFARGRFHSQTGISGVTTGSATSSLQGVLDSNEAYIWYGQMRVYNSDVTNFDRSAAYGNPGDWIVSGGKSNANNRFAEQFILGRMQMVLVEPVDHDSRTGTYTTSLRLGGADRKAIEENTVVSSNDPSSPAIFLQRKWLDPAAHHIEEDEPSWMTRARPLISPFTLNDPISIFQVENIATGAGRNRVVNTSDRTTLAGTSSLGKADTNYQALFGRTDVMGVGAKEARRRTRFLAQYDIDFPPSGESSLGDRYEWWQMLYATWNQRFWANPFLASSGFNAGEPNVNSKSVAQRQQIMANGVSQFIVEFAGDFVTQNQVLGPNYGTVTGTTPDGVIDFVAVPLGALNEYRRETRWYGLPRDVNGDGSIPGVPATARTSVDVLPVHRIIPPALFADPVIKWLPFERTITASVGTPLPPSIDPVTNDYANNVTEPAGATNPDDSAYKCVWGTRDFERVYTNTTPPVGTALNPTFFRGAYPTLIRFVVDVRDEDGKLAEPVTQELVYRVPDELPPIAN
jgi:prepilin-type N-terminal cleavage/methylation domain-containing protein